MLLSDKEDNNGNTPANAPRFVSGFTALKLPSYRYVSGYAPRCVFGHSQQAEKQGGLGTTWVACKSGPDGVRFSKPPRRFTNLLKQNNHGNKNNYQASAGLCLHRLPR